ncbi:hypothetical protein jhhlp_007934 [Lomentospora prolificans]|uniref:Amidohydrolase-related domain-containing protein n=1 Tax=Lomentospora prolificans TaxID=41688 RepID=A0A2N3N0Z2_9PEZI|nr:hypothetical protein jhhlp_007934 [Lomentospora prolificans]
MGAGWSERLGARTWRRRARRYYSTELRLVGLACLIFIAYVQWKKHISVPRHGLGLDFTAHGLSVERLRDEVQLCAKLHAKPIDPPGLGRKRNSRYVEEQKPTLIINATVWVGEPANDSSLFADNSSEKMYSWIQADVFLDKGLIQRVERKIHRQHLPPDTLVYDAKGRPLTSGIIDMHSHVGVHSLPTIHSNDDTSELSSNITPYVRVIDGFQPTDHQIQVIKSGGVTTSLVLPGSSNNIGGEAYVIKHAVGRAEGRNETSIADMLADPDGTRRYMKMACGENSKHVHGKAGERGPTSRLGESWEFRQAFERASKLMREQDDWCAMADKGIDHVRTYLPVDLEWEALVAVLRGQVHVNTHCYTINDLEAFVDHTNEFHFPVRAFHHAHQAFLVPEVLKRAWGGDPPALALFADNMWYKAEAYIGSEYAGKYLYDNGLTPIYVSDNPILNAQHVVFEAAKAYRYGLPYHAALASVTSAPAERLGLGQRLGKVKPGFDADIVVWDSDPLSIGAAPVQVWIDGAAQYDNPVELNKPFGGVHSPNTVLQENPKNPITLAGNLVFTGLTKAWPTDVGKIVVENGETFNVAVSEGKITCAGACHDEFRAASTGNGSLIHVKNGHLTPAFVAFGSTLGLNEIESEGVTDNGADGTTFSRAVDGLALNTTKLDVARRYGVTRAISSPKFFGVGTHHGTSVGFLTGATTVRDKGAVFSHNAALHYTLDPSVKRVGNHQSISAAVGALRDKLLDAVDSLGSSTMNSGSARRQSEETFLRKVVTGEMAISVTVHSADIIASLLDMKEQVEAAIISGFGQNTTLRMVIIGGAESHLLAEDLASSNVGVVLAPMQSYAVSWDQRRALTGAPLTRMTTIDVLTNAGVTTAIGLEEDWIVRDLSLLAAIAFRNGEGRLDEGDAMELIGRNVYKLLGLPEPDWREHFVIHEGNPMEIDSRIRAIGGGTGGVLLNY